MQAIVPYINFNGNAADALAFYSKALNGDIVASQTYGETQMPSTEEMKDKIMHAEFAAGALKFMASDATPDRWHGEGKNISLSLNFDDLESINNTFNGISDGGSITMELQDTAWGARFGMVTDKFGIGWMFNYDYPKDETSL